MHLGGRIHQTWRRSMILRLVIELETKRKYPPQNNPDTANGVRIVAIQVCVESVFILNQKKFMSFAWLLWRRAFFQGAVDFFEYAPYWTLFWVCTGFVENGCEKIDHPVDLYARYSDIMKVETERFRFR